MRQFSSLAAAALCCVATVAKADPMDPALSRLVLDARCNEGGEINTTDQAAIASDALAAGRDPRNGLCAPDHDAFKKLIAEWGFAIAPSAMHSARTTGYGGFEIGIQGSFTSINNDADYWTRGTEGERSASSGAASIKGSPPALVQLFSLEARKGFGFGLETGMNVGFVSESSIITGGADVRLSILEGFRTGVLGFLPDLAIGSGIRTISGTPQFQLTVVGLDAQVSKPFALADSSVLTPWIGYQYLWIFGDSGLIDLTPATDPLGYCGYTGPNQPGNADEFRSDRQTADGEPIYDGQPVCAGGSTLDFNNNVVFNRARLERQRILLGVKYRYEMVMGGIQFSTDLIKPADAQSSQDDEEALSTNGESIPRQWTLVFELGTSF